MPASAQELPLFRQRALRWPQVGLYEFVKAHLEEDEQQWAGQGLVPGEPELLEQVWMRQPGL